MRGPLRSGIAPQRSTRAPQTRNPVPETATLAPQTASRGSLTANAGGQRPDPAATGPGIPPQDAACPPAPRPPLPKRTAAWARSSSSAVPLPADLAKR